MVFIQSLSIVYPSAIAHLAHFSASESVLTLVTKRHLIDHTVTYQRFLTERDLEEIENRLSEVFMTKEEFAKYRSELMNKLDKILGEIVKSRQEQVVIAHRTTSHENRISKLEESVPTS